MNGQLRRGLTRAREPIVKRCGCGAVHTLAQWRALKLVGEFVDEVVELELRNCTCGSTISVEVAP